MISKVKINKVSELLAKAYQPENFFLFGSYAWGLPGKDSDLDLLVVVNKSSEKIYKRAIPGLRALRGLNIPKDIVVFTLKEFNKMIKETGSFLYKINKDGKLLYEKSRGLV